MTNKYKKLKHLFLFNALLLLVAFILIEYSVVKHELIAEQKADTQAILNDQDKFVSLSESSFDERLEMFDPPYMPHNIEFTNLLGRQMTLDDLKGQWIVLNFWASWCPPCIVEMPSLQALQDNYSGKGVRVVGIGLDRNMTTETLGQAMNKYNFGPVAAYYGDWLAIRDHFETPSLPTTYILSPSGHVVARLIGHADWMGEKATGLIEELIE